MERDNPMAHVKKCVIVLLVFVTFLFAAATTKGLARRSKRPPQYKHKHRNAMSQIVDGNYDGAIQVFEDFLAGHPNDLESFYGLAVAYTQKKDLPRAMQYVRQAVNTGLPFGRFLAGPRNLLKTLTGSDTFQEFAKGHMCQLVHGPMLGCVTGTSAKFWVRTAKEIPVQVSAHPAEKPDSTIKSPTVMTRGKNDFTAVIKLDGLKPNTDYLYNLMLNGVSSSVQWRFRTAPAKAIKCKFKIGFGGGAGYTPKHERMWNTIASHKPDAMLLLGDNVYIDHPKQTEVQQYCYYRRKSRPEYQSFVASTPIYAIYDDHDFGTNDCIGGPDIEKPKWKRQVWKTFKNNWVNPYYGGGEKQPGCWFDFSIGDVDFFMLDGRYYRTDPQKANPSMLGPVQKAWLLEKLAASKATFKVLAGPVPWSFGTKPVPQRTLRGMVPGGLDTWEGFKDEREEIFSLIEKDEIDGVILLSADRHRCDVRTIKRPNGYTLYEFESSKLTNIHTHSLAPGALFGYNEKCSFGLLTFDTALPEPWITCEMINIDNEVVYTLTLKKSQLTHKKDK